MDEILLPYAERIRALAKTAIGLEHNDVRTNSHLGGLPLVPDGFCWPERNGHPLRFLAQIDLDEVQAARAFDWLPRSGRLLFFYDTVEEPWGFESSDKGSARVVFVKAGVSTKPATPPAPYRHREEITVSRFNVLTFSMKTRKEMREEEIELTGPRIDLDPRAITTYPTGDDQVAAPLFEGLDKRKLDKLWNAYHDFRRVETTNPAHQIGGYADTIQGPEIDQEAERVSTGWDGTDVAELARRAAEWRLLLQLDTDDEAGWMWGDAGLLYFLVRETEARAGNFDNVWAILQCT